MKLSLTSSILLLLAGHVWGQSPCTCWQGKSFLKGEWTNSLGDFEYIRDYGHCGFVKICDVGSSSSNNSNNSSNSNSSSNNNNSNSNSNSNSNNNSNDNGRIVEAVLQGEASYFAITLPCNADSGICPIDELEVNNEKGLVHGGNAHFSTINPSFGYFRGKVIAYPDESDPFPEREVFHASAEISVYNAIEVECPASVRGCDKEFKVVSSGTCAEAGFDNIYDPDTCTDTVRSFGKFIEWGPNGGYPDVVDGCSLRSDTQVFLNAEGTCDPTLTACQCTDDQPCLCQKDPFKPVDYW